MSNSQGTSVARRGDDQGLEGQTLDLGKDDVRGEDSGDEVTAPGTHAPDPKDPRPKEPSSNGSQQTSISGPPGDQHPGDSSGDPGR
jgi:hypothetical protein